MTFYNFKIVERGRTMDKKNNNEFYTIILLLLFIVISLIYNK